MSIVKKLTNIQQALKVPKSQVNKFGGYKFRNCEDILEAVKPLLAENGLILNISDEIIHMGDRFYVQATAKVIDEENNSIEAKAFARESPDKKGMDASQITGSASSYARKYALNGLLCIDDTKDSDTPNKAELVEQIKRTFVTSNQKQNLSDFMLSNFAKRKLDELDIYEIEIIWKRKGEILNEQSNING